jgi:hypothetical protein
MRLSPSTIVPLGRGPLAPVGLPLPLPERRSVRFPSVRTITVVPASTSAWASPAVEALPMRGEVRIPVELGAGISPATPAVLVLSFTKPGASRPAWAETLAVLSGARDRTVSVPINVAREGRLARGLLRAQLVALPALPPGGGRSSELPDPLRLVATGTVIGVAEIPVVGSSERRDGPAALTLALRPPS